MLLGRRHRRAGFLPDIYVLPGGRVDHGDAAGSGFPERSAPQRHRPAEDGEPRSPALAFARAAIRETYEETGLLLAADSTCVGDTSRRPGMASLGARACRPGFEALDFVCRAITPTYSKRRYNTRFFLADGAGHG